MVLVQTLLWLSAILILYLGLLVFLRFRSNANHFKKVGLPYIGAGLGRIFRILSSQQVLVDTELEMYSEAIQFDTPAVGASDVFGTKIVYLTDLSLVRNVLIGDFWKSVNHREIITQNNFYWGKMLFSLRSEEWKQTRARCSPLFSTGNIRRMFDRFVRSSERLSETIDKLLTAEGGILDFAKIFPKYAMDVIASCAFGVESNETLLEMGKRLRFSFGPLVFLKFVVIVVAPWLANFLKLEALDVDALQYFENLTKAELKRRKNNKTERHSDFIEMMMEAKGEDGGSVFQNEEIVAHLVSFVVGGFDTVESLFLFAMYQLAVEPKIQEKVYKEVAQKVGAHGGKLTYEAVLDMKYLEMFFCETLRMYPPASRIERVCTEDYTIPGSDNVVIEKGTLVAIPIHCIHNDPLHFKNPGKFDPEKFSGNESVLHPRAFMPFAHGPRNCIGQRFGILEAKTVVAHLVSCYRFEPCHKTVVPIKFASTANLKPRNGMWLKVNARK